MVAIIFSPTVVVLALKIPRAIRKESSKLYVVMLHSLLDLSNFILKKMGVSLLTHTLVTL